MLTKEQKKGIIDKISKKVAESKVTVFCDFKGLTVQEISQLRSELRQEGVTMLVAKKNLIDLALKKVGVETRVKDLAGQVAIVYGGEDEVFSPKTINKFSKEHDSLKILKGLLEKKELSYEEVLVLAKLPNKEELLAKVVGSIKAPVNGLVNVLGGNLRNLVGVLKAIKESKN